MTTDDFCPLCKTKMERCKNAFEELALRLKCPNENCFVGMVGVEYDHNHIALLDAQVSSQKKLAREDAEKRIAELIKELEHERLCRNSIEITSSSRYAEIQKLTDANATWQKQDAQRQNELFEQIGLRRNAEEQNKKLSADALNSQAKLAKLRDALKEIVESEGGESDEDGWSSYWRLVRTWRLVGTAKKALEETEEGK